MAGTRLLIQGTFVVEFFLLALTALYFGLYRTKDPISFNLPEYQRGRALLRETLQKHERDAASSSSQIFSVPVVHVATTKEFAPQLEQSIQGHDIEFIIQVVEEDLLTACRLDVVAISQRYSMFVCPFDMKPASSSTTIATHHGVTFLYPKAGNEIEAMFRDLISTLPPPRETITTGHRHQIRKPLKLSLMMEHRRDWDAWAQALSTWTQTHQKALKSWPCIRNGNIHAQVVLSTLDEATTTTTKGSSLPRQISTVSMKTSVIDRQADSNAWNVMLYIPRVSPAQFVDASGEVSQAMYAGNTLVTTIDQAEQRILEETIKTLDENGNETTTIRKTEIPIPLEELITQAMTYPVTEFLLHQCMGANNSVVDDGNDSVTTGLPLWQMEAWLQRILKDTYQHANKQIQQEGEWILESSTWVVIDESVAAHWQTLHLWMRQVRQYTASAVATANNNNNNNNNNTGGGYYSDYLQGLTLLENILEYLQALRTDPILMEPLRLSAPQFLAIFAPLCLPLFLPHLIGLIREYKRFQKLREQKKQT